ncbi:MAG: lantibiotic dehydratase family protein [Hyphomicrobiales bacterium]
MNENNKSNYRYQYFPHFIIRSPLMSMDFVDEIIKGKNIDEEKLKSIFELAEVKEAIFIASPELYEELEKFLAGHIKKDKDIDRLKLSMLSYILRMSYRCTPFGLFAGFSRGEFSSESDIQLPEHKKGRKHTRLDMDVLASLAQELSKDTFLKTKIKWYPNTSAYVVGHQLRYVEYTYVNNRRNHHIVAVDNSSYLQKVLELAESGATFDEMAGCLVDEVITIDDSSAFINDIIDNQVVVSELDPAITGDEFIRQLLSYLEKIPEVEAYSNLLRSTLEALESADSKDLGAPVSIYKDIAEAFSKTGSEFDQKYFYQVDMVKKPKVCKVDRQVAQDCLEGLSVLNKLSFKTQESTLDQFKAKFESRYETRAMPLLTALDTEMGVGYGEYGNEGDITPLVDDIVTTPKLEEIEKVVWHNKINQFLLKKYTEGIQSDNLETIILDEEIENLKESWDDLPITMSSMVRVFGKEGDKNLISFYFASGSSAANLLGRFCHADKKTFSYVKEIIAYEEAVEPDKVFAEIIHLPEKRTGNILLRPVLRKYEIPFLGKSAVDKEFQIPLSDLYIQLQRNDLVLFSKSLGKEVVPRLSTAHNYSTNALPVYQFLCDMQNKNLRNSIGFGWGPFDRIAEFLPRVRYKNIIFSVAEWRVQKEKFEYLTKIDSDEELFKQFTDWRKSRKIPDDVYLADQDNELYLNLNNIDCIRVLISRVKSRPSFKIKECLFSKEAPLIKNKEGNFTNEIIISFFKTSVNS